MTTYFATGNKKKLEVAVNALKPYGIDIEQLLVETPEIQDTDVKKIAAYSAQFAANKTGKAVFVTDVGYYIPALNGFPGPFVKYTNPWLHAEGILRLMEGKENRLLDVQEAVAYCEPNQEPVIFCSSLYGTIGTTKIGESEYPFDTLVTWEGMDRVQTQCTRQELIDYWSKNLKHFHQLGEYLSKQ
jgi:XTP/dITP diphosphohydrolase